MYSDHRKIKQNVVNKVLNFESNYRIYNPLK